MSRAEQEKALQDLVGGARPRESDVMVFTRRGWRFRPPTIAPIREETVDYNLTTRDFTALVDATSAPVAVNLPPAASAERVIFVVKKIDGSGNAVTLTPDGTEEIDGASTHALSSQFDSVAVQSDGSNWWIIG